MTVEQSAAIVDAINSAGPDWAAVVQALVSILTLFAVYAAFIQLRQMKREFAADHARSRRQLAVELCAKWVEGQESATFEMCRFIDQLEKHQIDCILSSSPFTVRGANSIQLKKIFEGYEHADACLEKEASTSTTVTDLGSQHIRYLSVRYLNQLETVFIAWNSGICDKYIIEKQFGPLLDGRSGRNALSSFREQVGKQHFPNFDLFVQMQNEQSAKHNQPEPEIVN